MTPFQFKCSRCGTLLFEAEDILKYQTARNRRRASRKPPITEFIARKIGARCPKCGRELAKIPVRVDVYPIKPEKEASN